MLGAAAALIATTAFAQGPQPPSGGPRSPTHKQLPRLGSLRRVLLAAANAAELRVEQGGRRAGPALISRCNSSIGSV
jgi:hypothetical protein